MRFQYITLKEAALEPRCTQDQILRLVEEGHLRLYVRTRPHGMYRNWGKRYWRKDDPDDLKGIQQAPNEFASELLSNRSVGAEITTVICGEDRIKTELAPDVNDMFPRVRWGDVYLRQEDMESFVCSGSNDSHPEGNQVKRVRRDVVAAYIHEYMGGSVDADVQVNLDDCWRFLVEKLELHADGYIIWYTQKDTPKHLTKRQFSDRFNTALKVRGIE